MFPPGAKVVEDDEDNLPLPPGAKIVTQPPPPPPGFLSNLGSSALRFGQDVVAPVLHPEETLEGVTGLFKGMAEKSGFAPGTVSHAQNVDALWNFYKDRYGSIAGFKKAAYEDPVGVLADFATLATAGGAGAKGVQFAGQAARLGRTARVAGQVARGADVLSSVTDPFRIAGKLAGPLVNPLAERAAQSLRKGALRGGHTVSADPEVVARAAATMGESGIPFSQEGLEQLETQLKDLQAQKKAALAQGTATGKTIPRQAIIDDLLELRKRREKQVNPSADLAQTDALIDDIRTRQPADIPVELAEQLKEGTYKHTKWKPGETPKGPATQAAEKAAALSLKNHLETAIPELAELNPAQKKRLDLQPMLELAVRKYLNQGGFSGRLKKQMFGSEGLRIGALGGAAGYAAHDPITGIAAGLSADFLNAVLGDPKIQTFLAMQINQAQQLNPSKWGVPSMATALSRVEEYRKSLEAEKAK